MPGESNAYPFTHYCGDGLQEIITAFPDYAGQHMEETKFYNAWRHRMKPTFLLLPSMAAGVTIRPPLNRSV